MIEDLNIHNFALIDSVSVDFASGFNVLTGETGAGKSILIGALSFLLGGKSSVDQIRPGTTEACVSGTILLSDKQTDALEWLNQHGIELEDNRVLIRRSMKDSGKTNAWIQNIQVTRNELADFTSFLVDIHGQHEHQSLMKVSSHRVFLDTYAHITDEVHDFSKLYETVIEKRNLLQELERCESNRDERIAYLSFALDEIENAKFTKGEDEVLENEECKLSQFEKLFNDIDSLVQIFSNEGESVSFLLKKASSIFDHASSIDGELAALYQRFETVFYELTDIIEEIKKYQSNMSFDAQRMQEVQERLALIFKLKNKYLENHNASIEDLLAFSEKSRNELETLQNSAVSKKELQEEIQKLERELYIKATEISKKRRVAASRFSKEVEDILETLGMKGIQFCAEVSNKASDGETQKCSQFGIDSVEFLISANPGSPLKSLAKIASGGELSRVMLAIKTVLVDVDTIGTMIFDEIDTGIGGEVALSLGSHLQKLAKNSQVFCISHLASIAVCADNHIKIEKSVDNGKTTTHVFGIDGDKRVIEIARMLSGDTNTSASLDYARSLLEKYGG